MDEIRYRCLHPDAQEPIRANDGDAGFDLHAVEPARLGPGQRVSIGTGISIAVPDGMAGLVLPRSGLALKHGIALVNSPGLIDSGYRGEVRVLLLNTDPETAFAIEAGDRIAQLLLVPFASPRFRQVDELDETERGEGGFGSSGRI